MMKVKNKSRRRRRSRKRTEEGIERKKEEMKLQLL